MKYSEKLNGYWEEGYHYYLEFRDEKLSVMDYARRIMLETEVSYDADKLEAGERTVITLKENVLSRTWEGKMMTEIKELAYENGELKMLYNYTIMGENLYTLTKQDGGPFRHIIIRDDEFMDKLQGRWEEWTASGREGNPMIIVDNTISWFGGGGTFHAVSYTYDKDSVYLVPYDLTTDNFTAFTRVRVLPDHLETTMMVCDMSMPVSVFARKDMLDKIEIPESAKRPAVNTMMYRGPGMVDTGMMGFGPLIPFDPPKNTAEDVKKDEVNTANKTFCKTCGADLTGISSKFCPECGARRDTE